MLTSDDQKIFSKKILDAGLIPADKLSAAEQQSGDQGLVLHHYLIQAGLLSKTAAHEILAEIYGVPYVDIANFKISTEAVQAIPAELAHRYKVLPLLKIGDSLNVAMANPTEVNAIDHLAQKSHCKIDPCLAALEDIESALTQYYGSGNAVSHLLESLSRERSRRTKPVIPVQPSQKLTGRGTGADSVVSLVDLIIRQAFEEGASDIHIEPEEKMLRVRYRVDGVLHESSSAPKQLESEMISRIKVLSQMDIAENRVPQDGRIKMTFDGKDVDMRVSSMPTVYGENLVIRLLKDSHQVPSLMSLGMSEDMQKVFESMVHSSYGMILETGPTGSGKTTTLYAAINTINSVERNIITVEDPVEYKLPMIRQTQINVKAGLHFASALRSILRQDPDVIMVGEIRDRETAEIAIQAALTGHLVFSTLHTNSAATVMTRLADMKIEPFLIASSIIGAVSQRLVRKLCDNCKEEEKADSALLKVLQVPEGQAVKAFRGRGCHQCRQSGYKGRVGIFEILKMNDAIRKKITAGCDFMEIELEARKTGFRSMREDGLDKIMKGITSLEEVVKAVCVG
jgi:type IV pilus assembly protein PilB